MHYLGMSRKQQRRRFNSRMEPLPHHVVELIMEKLPVSSLLRFKRVSKQWKSTIAHDPLFQKRQLNHHRQQRHQDPDLLMVSVCPYDVRDPWVECLRTLVLGSSSSGKIYTPWENTIFLASGGGYDCDGLVCLYERVKPVFVINPTTRRYRLLPLSQLQQVIIDIGPSYFFMEYARSSLGFGKDKFNGTYKPVWLHNSSEIGLPNATTCEVFDFSTNAWRYVTPASPYRVFGFTYPPVYVDGSLHWFTQCEETKVLSFDLHTESFQVVSKAPFARVHYSNIVMCNLDNQLCVSEMQLTTQVIWSFNSGNKTWDKMFSIDVDAISHCFDTLIWCLWPLALVHGEENKNNKTNKKKKKKLLFYIPGLNKQLLVHDPETESYHVAYHSHSLGTPLCYFQSLISIP